MENTAKVTADKARILVAEDDPNLGIILTEYLEAKGYAPILAKNGVEGWKKFSNNEFDLCILDVMMPEKDGFSLAKDIRKINEEILYETKKRNLEDYTLIK